jgi:hypothetical protein
VGDQEPTGEHMGGVMRPGVGGIRGVAHDRGVGDWEENGRLLTDGPSGASAGFV